MNNISQKIYNLRTEYNLTQAQLAKIAGVSDKAVSAWELGTRDPKIKPIQNICVHFGIDVNSFIDQHTETFEKKPTPAIKNILPRPKTYKVPLIGTIACGQPILAVEEAEETVDVPEWVDADFALMCKGDSMINARIFHGDIVYIREQPEVENGQIAAVRIGEEATLKKVYYAPDAGRIVLRACNPMCNDMIFEGETLNQITVLGLAVGFYSKVRHE